MNGKGETVNILDTAWWKQVQAEHKPGDSIKAYRTNRGLTLAQLSAKAGIAESHLLAMENGKRGVGRITAVKLGRL